MPNQRIAALFTVFGCSWLLAASPTLSQNSSGLRPPIWGNPKPNPNAIAQSSPLRFLIREGNRLGYIDQTGKVVIPPQFAGHESGAFSLHDAIAFGFHDGLAPANMGKQWGYINVSGQFVISPQFDHAQPFVEGLAAVEFRRGNAYPSLWGYIDKTGELVIKPHFEEAANFQNELAAVKRENDSAWSYIDKTGKFVWTSQD